ncbi:hypothetical protein CRE_24448 [Caenorhabditis remanei]|uniref:Uncharacterized protein n=1 Tax=Caenorhabditis remanei TaxID=31234 RepID=E3MG37_CAERE|nr:hypothetical protein CRE_24448 [Caenorhabditis remanei]
MTNVFFSISPVSVCVSAISGCPQNVFLSGTAHCADMYGASSLDSVYLTNARQKISDVLDGWLKAK